MSKDSYGVHPVNLKEADNFEVLILLLPENEINDKLTYLTREKGKISRSFFEDFVISNCVANINQLLSYINQNLGASTDLLKIREELMESILKFNPQLAPENLIINKNYVVKIKKLKNLKNDEKLIIENVNWDVSYYENINEDNSSLSNMAEDKEKDIKKLKNKVKEKIKDIDELEYDVKQVWWKRIGQYIEIKQFNEEDTIHILKKRYFHSPTSFNTFIVSVCIIGFEELFMLLDNMGIPSRVAPPILMNELYELCRSLNKFLTYSNAQEVSDDPNNLADEGGGKRPQKTATAGLMHKYGKNKPKKKFKDIPKEDLLNLADNMKVFLIGQDPAINTLVDTIQRAKIGLKDPVKPIGSFLFAGRTGVGKTLATKVLADELIKNRDNLITIDCSEYSADHEYSKLIGSPAGYIQMVKDSLHHLKMQ
jgi:flagellar biosynthesis GTPase FlhF